MATITAALVKELRESTGAGMMDCKAALTQTDGDFEAAVDWLRKKGLSKAAKKADRVAAEGLVAALVVREFWRRRRGEFGDGLRRPQRRFPDAGEEHRRSRLKERQDATSRRSARKPIPAAER